MSMTQKCSSIIRWVSGVQVRFVQRCSAGSSMMVRLVLLGSCQIGAECSWTTFRLGPNFVELQSDSDRILSRYSQVGTEFCQATVELGQLFYQVSVGLEQICIRILVQNFVRLQSK